MAFDTQQFRELVTEVLKETDLYSEAAVELLLLTAAVESNFGTYLKQIKGPALGVFQMEPRTEDDIWDNYLEYKPSLASMVREFGVNFAKPEMDLKANLVYQIIMARLHYLRIKEPLPDANDVEKLAAYWKRHYNTRLGKGTVAKAIEKYNEYCV